MKRCGRGSPGRLYGKGTNPCVTCWKVPYIGPERGKFREANPVSAINTDEEKSGKCRAEARGNSAPLPHMAHPPAYSVVHHVFLAIGRLNPVLCMDAIPQVGKMSPGVGHNNNNYYYYYRQYYTFLSLLFDKSFRN